MPSSSSTARWRAPGGSRSSITALTAPVPGPSSTTTGAPAVGTIEASTADSRGELGTTAPIVRGPPQERGEERPAVGGVGRQRLIGAHDVHRSLGDDNRPALLGGTGG